FQLFFRLCCYAAWVCKLPRHFRGELPGARLEGWLKRNYRQLSSERNTSVFQAALSCRTLSTGAEGMRRRILPKHRKSDGFYQCFVLCIITMTITLCANSPVHGRTSQSRGIIGTGPKAAQAARVERAPRLDGTLNDPLWQAAEPVGDFLQREPHEGQTPTETTEVRVLYTRHEVYFGVLCRDSAPKAIVATE